MNQDRIKVLILINTACCLARLVVTSVSDTAPEPLSRILLCSLSPSATCFTYSLINVRSLAMAESGLSFTHSSGIILLSFRHIFFTSSCNSIKLRFRSSSLSSTRGLDLSRPNFFFFSFFFIFFFFFFLFFIFIGRWST